MEQAELQRTEGGSPVQGWLRAWAGEREETPPGTCESFPPGAGLRASEWSLCAWGRWKDTRITHWNFQPTPGTRGVGDVWMFRGQLLRGFRVWKKWCRSCPAGEGPGGTDRGILLGDPSGPLMFLWVGESRWGGCPRAVRPFSHATCLSDQ